MNIGYNLSVALILLSLVFNAGVSAAAEVSVAVASNALQAMKDIKGRYEKATGNTVLISSGSTGKLYAQIVNGAPFDIFLAANTREPLRLEKAKAIVPGSRMTYAVGRLVLWNNALQVKVGAPIQQLLSSSDLKRITLANPRTAPYGFAAQELLQSLKLWDAIQGKLIRAENVTQAFQFTQSQNVQLGFVALSQIKGYQGHVKENDYWLVPQKYYTPIEQQGVLLLHASNNVAARQFMEYLKTPQVKQLLQERYGYGA
jgi:molybdate transport system substrate-binding protein